MTKKRSKNRKQQQESFVPNKSVIIQSIKQSPIQKNRNKNQSREKRRTKQKVSYYKQQLQQTRAQQQKHKQKMILKQIQKQKKQFMGLRYQNEWNSQFAQIDQQSVQIRIQNQVLTLIRTFVEDQELQANGQKTHQLCQKVQQIHQQNNQIVEEQNSLRQKINLEHQQISQIVNGQQNNQIINQNYSGVKQQIEQDVAQKQRFLQDGISKQNLLNHQRENIFNRIRDLESIYY